MTHQQLKAADGISDSGISDGRVDKIAVKGSVITSKSRLCLVLDISIATEVQHITSRQISIDQLY